MSADGVQWGDMQSLTPCNGWRVTAATALGDDGVQPFVRLVLVHQETGDVAIDAAMTEEVAGRIGFDLIGISRGWFDDIEEMGDE